ncbi:MAG TPA: hypothetical protein VH370_27375 [Humisphaera sp.]|jgi:uncharacterized membrane protein YeaQ/YmgE (transglycosylase-associated protein family)|nr:hypothetical protein [Humisphaera sp.]
MKGSLILLGVALCIGAAAAALGQATQPSTAPIEQAKSTAQELQHRAVDTASKIKEEGLPPGTIIALIVVGAFAGNTVGNLLRMTNTLGAHLISLLLGGVGTVVAAFVVNVTGLSLGWPQIAFKSESLVLALIVTFVLMLIFVKTRGSVHRMTGTASAPTPHK